MTNGFGGMPLLSGPLPSSETSEASCRKCNKDFNVLFTRSRKCNHCGYAYCHSCADYQALMPRSGTESGYDPMPVCAFCIQYLTLTAGGKGYLRTMPMTRLKNYIQSYNIKLGPDVLEKDDLIDTIIAVRSPNGCLPWANENYYRKHSVPNAQTSRPRGLFSRSTSIPPSRNNQRQNPNTSTPWNHQNSFPRPDLEPDSVPPQHQRQNNSPGSTNAQARTTSAHAQQSSPPRNPPPQQQRQNSQPPYVPYTSNRQRSGASASGQGAQSHYNAYGSSRSSNNQQPRPPEPRQNPQPTPPRPTAPPSLDHLLTLDRTSIAAYPVSTLKAILFSQHVSAPSRLVLEKSDLVERVCALLEDERRERQRLEQIRIAEEAVEREERARREGWNTWERERGPVGTAGGAGAREDLHMDVDEGVPSRWEFERDYERERARARAQSAGPSTSTAPFSPPQQPSVPATSTSASRRSRQARVEVEDEAEAGSTYEVSVHGSDSGSGSDADADAMDVRLDGGGGEFRTGASNERERASSSTPTPPVNPAPAPVNSNARPPQPPRPTNIMERSGLCIVCQDEEANIVVVDCGHLALCRGCSDLVMASSRECPLCRTRIVTESRLLRVFRT